MGPHRHDQPRSTLPNVTAVRHVRGRGLRVRFDDGVEGDVELDGDLAPLRDPAYVVRVEARRDLGAIAWPNGAELDPVVLHLAAWNGGDVHVPLH